MTDQELRDRLTDFSALALTIFVEARGESVEGRIAVGCVVRNRVKAPRRFGSTYKAVCHQRSQFSCWWTFGGADNYALIYAIARALVTGQPVPLEADELALYQECLFLAEGIIGEQLRDNVRKATHYYNPMAMTPRGSMPTWASGLLPVVVIGRHRFYAGVK